jgi:copper chaperone CopZ
MKTIMMTSLLVLLTFASWGQKVPKTQTIVIHTSAECQECKEKIESGLNFTKGVVFAELDIPSRNLTVKYSTKKMTPEKLRAVINELGYDADETKANPEALHNLPDCCKPGGMEKHGQK